jgi:prenyltransferase beta subunit
MRRLTVILVVAGLLLSGSAGAASNPAAQASLDKTVRYLQEAQQLNGGFAASGEPSQITSAWTALALAAAGVNPQDQRREGGLDAFSYLASNYRTGVEESECAPVACTTTIERELMVVNASGADPHDFADLDLVAELLAHARPDGAFSHLPGGQTGVNDTIFAIFALVPIAEPAAQAAIQPAAKWIESLQHPGGGWAWSASSAQDEVDMTGAAIQALIAAGRGRNGAIEAGINYLRDAQNPDGGFPEFPGNPESNVASTAWATQAIWAVGENAEDWRTGSGLATEEPLDYMESLQEPDGHIRWKGSQDLNGIWMTAYCSVALGGHKWPIPAAPRSSDPPQPPASGQGEGNQSGAGVIAGGGGNGAPLFSRPKPQSKGRTPGGSRTTRNRGVHATNHSKSRRGANEKQPEGTQRTEATASSQELETSGSDRPAPAGESRSGPGASRDDNSGGSQSPGALSAAAPRGRDDAGSGEEVTGTVIGSPASERDGQPIFGAPGLHGAGIEDGDEGLAAVAIGSLALLVALWGASWERRHREALL